jgi:hypothetical protein
MPAETQSTKPGLLMAVLTTIQMPTMAVQQLAGRLKGLTTPLIVIGDRKGPDGYALPGTHFLSLADQLNGPFDLAQALPTGHYARKNLGYLEAIRLGADCIYETDDDNAPLSHWARRSAVAEARAVDAAGWVNAYRGFTDQRIWPRGFPLDALAASFTTPLRCATQPRSVQAPIQQGLADGSPDVDAIWRLVLDAPFAFEVRPSLFLPPGAWCPFNSQSTWWWPQAYPLLYLPSHCSFRMTDIWRSFVAQRCLWAMGAGVVFHAPEVVQERNRHDLMRDFADEVPGYLHNRRIAEILDALTLAPGPERAGDNLRVCYEALVRAGILPRVELDLVDLWLGDLANLSQCGTTEVKRHG